MDSTSGRRRLFRRRLHLGLLKHGESSAGIPANEYVSNITREIHGESAQDSLTRRNSGLIAVMSVYVYCPRALHYAPRTFFALKALPHRSSARLTVHQCTALSATNVGSNRDASRAPVYLTVPLVGDKVIHFLNPARPFPL